MRLTFWGTRGSLATPGAATSRYGGNTSCVEVRTDDPHHVVVLDAGTGIRPLGEALGPDVRRVDVLLGHLHLDHIVGLGFFAGFFRPDTDVHVWGPASTTRGLRSRLTRYLSPPLFPVRLRDLPARPHIHDVPLGRFEIPGLDVEAQLICHPDPTVGYRLTDGTSTVAYLSDHEPALGSVAFPTSARWMSGARLANGADLLVHDAQYLADEYPQHVGWGHGSLDHAIAFARRLAIPRLVGFHHDPGHDDDCLARAYAAVADLPDLDVSAAREGTTLSVGR